MKRRIKRRYRRVKGNSGVKFLGFIGIIVGAVICGYLTARFVAAPLLGYETEVLHLDFPSKLTVSTEERNKEKNPKTTKNEDDGQYALQFGVFSTASGAKEMVQTLQSKSIDAEVQKIDGTYKVLSEAYGSKASALKRLEKLKEEQDIDVFITRIP